MHHRTLGKVDVFLNVLTDYLNSLLFLKPLGVGFIKVCVAYGIVNVYRDMA